jgi:transcriptional regulator with XRE-family HTH domain
MINISLLLKYFDKTYFFIYSFDMNLVLPTIGQRIKFALDAAKLKQKDLADRLGVNPTTVSGYITGKIDASVEVVRAVAEMAGVTLDWLITGEGPMQRGTIVAEHLNEDWQGGTTCPTDEEMKDLPDPFQEAIKAGYKLSLANRFRIAADILDKVGDLEAEEQRKKQRDEGK